MRPAATARPWGEVLEDIGRRRSDLAQLERVLRGTRWYQRRRKGLLRDQIAANRAATDALVDELAGGRRELLVNLAEMSRRRREHSDGQAALEYERLVNEVATVVVVPAEESSP